MLWMETTQSICSGSGRFVASTQSHLYRLSYFHDRTLNKCTHSYSRSHLTFYLCKHPLSHVNGFFHPARKHALFDEICCRHLCSRFYKSSSISTSRKDLISCLSGRVARRTIRSSMLQKLQSTSWYRQGNRKSWWIYCAIWRTRAIDRPFLMNSPPLWPFLHSKKKTAWRISYLDA